MSIVLAKSTVGQRLQLGLQTSSGTGVPGAHRLPTVVIDVTPETESNEYQAQGNKFTSDLVPTKEWTTWKGTGAGTYGELPVFLTSVFGTAVGVTDTGVTTWTMQPTDGVPDTPNIFTFEWGDDTDGMQSIDNVADAFGLEWDRSKMTMTSGGFGKALATSFSLTSQAAVWTVTLGAGNTDGYFTLTFNSQTTGHIAFDATGPIGVQAALGALSTIGVANVTVTGSAGGPYTVNFIGALNGTTLALTGSGASLTGGSATITLLQTGTGVSFYERQVITPQTIGVYLDTSFSGLGGTKLANPISGKFDVTGRWGMEWITDDDDVSYAKIVETKPSATLSLLFEADATARGYIATYRAGTLVYVRIKALGPVIASSTHYQFDLDVPLKIKKISELKDDGGVYAIGFDFAPISDPVAGFPMRAMVVNATPSL